MKIINTVDGIFARFEWFLIVCLLSIMIVLSFGQMISRNFFHQALIWGDTLLRQLVLWTGFLGASLAVSKNKHISIDVLSNFLPPKFKKKINNLNCFFASIISGFLAWAAWSFVLFEKESQSILFLDLPVWIFLLILPYSFLMIALRFFFKSIESSKEESIQETS